MEMEEGWMEVGMKYKNTESTNEMDSGRYPGDHTTNFIR